jgi:hypothetical protein
MADNKELAVAAPAPPRSTDLFVHFHSKDEAKQLGARFDWERKLWYAPPGTPLGPLQPWTSATRAIRHLQAQGAVYLTVGFADKDLARGMGAQFDTFCDVWFVPPGVNAQPFLNHWQPVQNPAEWREEERVREYDDFYDDGDYGEIEDHFNEAIEDKLEEMWGERREERVDEEKEEHLVAVCLVLNTFQLPSTTMRHIAQYLGEEDFLVEFEEHVERDEFFDENRDWAQENLS